MTQQPFNINTVLEEFDKTMVDLDATDIKLFIISSLRRSMEAVKPSERKRYFGTWDEYKSMLEQNQTNFFNETKV